MNGVLSILAICVVAAAICVLLSRYSPEFAFAAACAAGAAVLFCVTAWVAPVLERLSKLIAAARIESYYFKTAVKAVGIGCVSQFAADICRDFGQSSLASKAELAGRCAVLVLSVPLLEAIAEIAFSFLEGL